MIESADMKHLLICLTLLLCAPCVIAQTPAAEPVQLATPRYRLYKTHNTWTHLLLDTRTGRLWQVHFSVEKDGVRGKLPIREMPLVNEDTSRDGRFILQPTENIWTFLLLDQDFGGVFQCHYSMDASSARLCFQLLPLKP